MRRYILLTLGFLSLLLAIIGIILPGVPGIPFILLTFFFFSISSEKWTNLLHKNKITGKVFRKIQERKSNKWFIVFVLSQLCVSMIVFERLFFTNPWFSVVFYTIGLLVLIFSYFLFKKIT